MWSLWIKIKLAKIMTQTMITIRNWQVCSLFIFPTSNTFWDILLRTLQAMVFLYLNLGATTSAISETYKLRDKVGTKISKIVTFTKGPGLRIWNTGRGSSFISKMETSLKASSCMEANSDKACTSLKTDVCMKDTSTMVLAMGSANWPSARSSGTKVSGS